MNVRREQHPCKRLKRDRGGMMKRQSVILAVCDKRRHAGPGGVEPKANAVGSSLYMEAVRFGESSPIVCDPQVS